MKTRIPLLAAAVIVPAILWGTWLQPEHPQAVRSVNAAENLSDEANQQLPQAVAIPHPETVAEARARARLLHETIHGSLQIMHRDFFRDDEGLPIPSHSLEDVFEELAKTYDVRIHWLVVNARAMNVDNRPRNDFEKQAVTALSSGKDYFEVHTKKQYQYAGAVRLASQCLKCHLPARNSNKSKTAGLVIQMPLKSHRPEKNHAESK